MRKSIHTLQNEALRQELRRLRKAADLTQAGLSKRLRKPQSFVSKYETGERRLDFIELLHVLEILGANVCALAKTVTQIRKS